MGNTYSTYSDSGLRSAYNTRINTAPTRPSSNTHTKPADPWTHTHKTNDAMLASVSVVLTSVSHVHAATPPPPQMCSPMRVAPPQNFLPQ